MRHIEPRCSMCIPVLNWFVLTMSAMTARQGTCSPLVGCAGAGARGPRSASRRHAGSRSAPSSSTARRPACSTPSAGSASSSSTRSPPSRPPQELVLWSRLGAVRPDRARPAAVAGAGAVRVERVHLADRVAADRPGPDAPLATSTRYAHERWSTRFLAENRPFRRYVLRELERRGPLLSRELEDRAAGEPRDHRWYGSRRVGLMLTILHLRGEVAIAGRRGKQRLWDLAERWYPPGEALPLAAGRARARRAAVPRARRPAREGPLARASGRRRRPGADRADAPLAVRPPDPRP